MRTHRRASVASFVPFQRGRGGPGGWWILDKPELQLEAKVPIIPDLASWRVERMPELPDAYFSTQAAARGRGRECLLELGRERVVGADELTDRCAASSERELVEAALYRSAVGGLDVVGHERELAPRSGKTVCARSATQEWYRAGGGMAYARLPARCPLVLTAE